MTSDGTGRSHVVVGRYNGTTSTIVILTTPSKFRPGLVTVLEGEASSSIEGPVKLSLFLSIGSSRDTFDSEACPKLLVKSNSAVVFGLHHCRFQLGSQLRQCGLKTH
jgi:hypothetical protein